MKKYSQEFKVGLFIVICLAGLAYLTLSTGKVTLVKEGYCIYAVFDEVAGLNKKAPVMLNGFEVGKVEDVKLAYDNAKTTITLKLLLNKGVKVSKDSEISIKTLGLMGEKYIQIKASQNPDFIEPETVIIGKPYADMDTLITNLNMTLDDNKERISSIMTNLDSTMKNMDSASKNFDAFSDDIKRHPWKLLVKTKEKDKDKGKGK
jgi:phospholipid/cholesterol/gamma-HCH transport system substrate-binding protein